MIRTKGSEKGWEREGTAGHAKKKGGPSFGLEEKIAATARTSMRKKSNWGKGKGNPPVEKPLVCKGQGDTAQSTDETR